MLKRIICCFMVAAMLMCMLPIDSIVADEEITSYNVELKNNKSEFIRNCTLDVYLSENGTAMARFDELCELLDLEYRSFSGKYVCRKKGLISGNEPENPTGEEIVSTLGRYQFVFLDGVKNAVQVNYIFGAPHIPLPEEPRLMDGSLFVPLASFVRLNSGYIRVDGNKIVLSQPKETITDIIGWEANEYLWIEYFFDPIGFLNENSWSMLGPNPSQVVYIFDGIYDRFHDIFDALFTFDFSGVWNVLTGGFVTEYGEAMAQVVCSKTDAEKDNIELLKKFGEFDIDAMEHFANLFAEANGEVLKDIEARSGQIFEDMLNGSIAQQAGFTQLKELAGRVGKEQSKQAFYKAISNEALFSSASIGVDILASYFTILNEVEKASDFDIHAMERYIELSNEYNTAIEPTKVREGLESKTDWFSSHAHSNFNDRLTEAVISKIEDIPLDFIGQGIASIVGSFPKGAALKGILTYEAIGLVWDLVDELIAETLGDLGDAKLSINLGMLSRSAFDTFISENASGQDGYDNKLALVYVYLKSCYASRQLMLDNMKTPLVEEAIYEEFFADDLAQQNKLGRLLAKLAVTTDMGADQNLFDSLGSFDKAFSDALSNIDVGTELIIPEDAVYWNGHYYKLLDGSDPSTSFDSWELAEKYCESLNGHLATLTSYAENRFVCEYISSLNVSSAYFGLTDASVEGTWTWVTGEPFDYSGWPRDWSNAENSSENYAMLHIESSDGKWAWDDGQAGSGANYICEWDSEYYNFWMDFIDNKGWRNRENDYWYNEEDHYLEYLIVDLDNDDIPELLVSENQLDIFYDMTVWKIDGESGSPRLIKWKEKDYSGEEEYILLDSQQVCYPCYSKKCNSVVFRGGRQTCGVYDYDYYSLVNGEMVVKYLAYYDSNVEEYSLLDGDNWIVFTEFTDEYDQYMGDWQELICITIFEH